MAEDTYITFLKLGAGIAVVILFASIVVIIEPEEEIIDCDLSAPAVNFEKCSITPNDIWADPFGYHGRIITVRGSMTFNDEDFAIFEAKRTWDREIWVSYNSGDSDEIYERDQLVLGKHCVYSGIVRGMFYHGPSGHMGTSSASLQFSELLEYERVGCYEGNWMPVEDSQ